MRESISTRLIVEEGKHFFKKESLFRKVSEILFLLREDS